VTGPAGNWTSIADATIERLLATPSMQRFAWWPPVLYGGAHDALVTVERSCRVKHVPQLAQGSGGRWIVARGEQLRLPCPGAGRLPADDRS
jgi:hypothetical protein